MSPVGSRMKTSHKIKEFLKIRPKKIKEGGKSASGERTVTTPKKGKTGKGPISGNVYEVERIEDKKTVNGVPYYYVKWIGWDQSTNTWEPVNNLQGCRQMVDDFEKEREHWPEQKKDYYDDDDDDDETMSPAMDDDFPSAPTTPSPSKNKSSEDISTLRRGLKIYEELPSHLQLLKVTGAVEINKDVYYAVKIKISPEMDNSDTFDFRNVVLVRSSGLRRQNPKQLIRYFERKIRWI